MNKPINRWDERYGGEEFYYGKEPNDFLSEQASKIKSSGQVLCLAEGEGRNAVYLASLGYQVTAIDSSAEGLRKLDLLAQERGVRVQTIQADLAEYKIEKKWDGIVSIWCHLPPALRQRVHAQIVDGLVTGGKLILESYTPDQLKYKTGGPPDAALLTTQIELREQFKDLKIIIAEEKLRNISEGKGHLGLSAVVQVLAEKS